MIKSGYAPQNESIDEANGTSDTYMVSGKDSAGTLTTSDPAKAIERWFKLCKASPTMTTINTARRADAVRLVKWAEDHLDKIAEWHEKYKCNYKLDYLQNEIKKQVANGCRFFYEDKRATAAWEGDQIHPFSAG